MKELKGYNELLEEELRLKAEVMSSRQKVSEHFSIQHQAKGLVNSVKSMFSGSSSSESEYLTNEFVETDTSKAKEEVIQLLTDLTYEALAIALLRKPKNPKSFFNKSSVVSLKIVLKSILDQYYYNNKEKVSETISKVINKGINFVKKK